MRTILSVIISFVALAGLNSQNQIPYSSATLSPYSGELDILSGHSAKDAMYTRLETGFGGFFQLFIGTGTNNGREFYWAKWTTLTGGRFSSFSMNKDEPSSTCRDTIRQKFNEGSEMVALEVIHDLPTNEIKYVWLDGNNERSEKAVLIPIDQPLKKGKVFPDLTVEKLDGEQLSVKDMKGKIVVINWWATTCAPCIAEMPGFNTLVEKYKDDPGIVFLAIAFDQKKRLTGFLQKNEFNYIQTVGDEKALELFEVSFPKNVIVDQEGKIGYYSIGGSPNKYEEIEREINRLLQ